MTVIAWDGKTLAADKRMCYAGGVVQTTTKIFHVVSQEQDVCLVGVTGDFSVGMELVDWFADGAKAADFRTEWRNPDVGACLMVVREGSVVQYESSPVPVEFAGRFCASGSGTMAALAAMHCGRSAAEAVEIASLYCSGCGNGIDTLELE